MNKDEIKKLDQEYIMPTYLSLIHISRSRFTVVFMLPAS